MVGKAQHDCCTLKCDKAIEVPTSAFHQGQRHCRKESPNVVEAFHKYRQKEFTSGKGFEVFSVSLDRDQEAWKQAIVADKLIWMSHVLEAQGLASANYQVATIPNAFLLDGNGVVVASGAELRGLNLHITLDKFLK